MVYFLYVVVAVAILIGMTWLLIDEERNGYK